MQHNLKIHNFEQGSEEWLQIRLGKMTGSKASLLLVNGNDKLKLGKQMTGFIYQKVFQFQTGAIKSVNVYSAGSLP